MMNTQTPDLQAVVERQCRELAERLDKVEDQCGALAKQNRRLKIAGVMLLVIIGGVTLLCLAKGHPAVIRAEKLEVRDAAGRTRVLLTEDVLRFFAANGDRQFSLTCSDNPDIGAWLSVYNRYGYLYLRPCGVNLHEADSTERLILGNDVWGPEFSKRPLWSLSLHDKDGNVIWQAPPPDDAPEEAPPPAA